MSFNKRLADLVFIWSFLLVILAVSLSIVPASAQPGILIEYVKVPKEQQQSYLQMQKASRAYHEKLFKDGKIYVWYHYAVRFPLDETAGYNHVVVTVFADTAAMPVRNKNIAYAAYIASAEIYEPVHKVQSEGYGTMASPYASINFWRAEPANMQAFFDHMTTTMKPVLENFVASGQWKTYGLFARKWPADASIPYNFALVTRHSSFAGAETPAPLTVEANGTLNAGIPTRAKTELWKLLDIIL